MSSIQAALSYIPANDRDMRIRIGMAIKSELGQDGYQLWFDWTQTGPHPHSDKDMKVRWDTFKQHGGTSIASLYWEARQNGWDGKIDLNHAPRTNHHQTGTPIRQRNARAEKIWNQTQLGTHPYLEKKDLGNYHVPIYQDTIVVPMYFNDLLMSLQFIHEDGTKKYLSGSKTSGCSHTIQRGNSPYPMFICEGFADALTVHKALRNHLVPFSVCIAFSAMNIPKVAVRGSNSIVVCDRDPHGLSEKMAQQTGLPYFIPESEYIKGY